MFDEFVQDQECLRRWCERLRQEPWLALDTEFVRERTYYAQACLMQIASRSHLICVDLLALPDPGPLFALIDDPAITKILHAARQDLELYCQMRTRAAVPGPLVDTQIAAALAGFAEQISYADLVQALLGVKLEKHATRTDWAQRPLSEVQLRYAAEDVRYLGALHDELKARLAALGRQHWLTEECAGLTDPARYRSDPRMAYTRIRQGHTLPASGQQVLRALAQWREATAQGRDLPRAWVLSDVVLLELARRQPRSVQELGAIHGLSAGAARRWGTELLGAITDGLAAPAIALYAPRPRPSPTQRALYQRLAARVAERARAHGLRPALIASRAELEAFIADPIGSVLVAGWRRELVGAELLALRDTLATTQTAE